VARLTIMHPTGQLKLKKSTRAGLKNWKTLSVAMLLSSTFTAKNWRRPSRRNGAL
jgi:hypothetical protein